MIVNTIISCFSLRLGFISITTVFSDRNKMVDVSNCQFCRNCLEFENGQRSYVLECKMCTVDWFTVIGKFSVFYFRSKGQRIYSSHPPFFFYRIPQHSYIESDDHFWKWRKWYEYLFQRYWISTYIQYCKYKKGVHHLSLVTSSNFYFFFISCI